MLSPEIDESGPELTRPFRVLFLQRAGNAAQMRIRPLLDLLRSQGDISGYAVVDRDMSVSGDVAEHYDVVLAHRIPSSRQIAWLRRTSPRFAYDIDDLLLPAPGERLRGQRAIDAGSVAWCLANARCVSAPSQRLLATLETRLRAGFGERSRLILNAGAEEPPPVKKFARPRLLWTSSAELPASDDILSACKGIDAALRAIDTDIVLVGRFAPGVLDQFSRSEYVPWLPPELYRRLLAAGPFVGVRPLPMDLSPEMQTFIGCKSDIRAAEYGSNRIAAVYSAVPPYTESDLPCCIAPTNSAGDWQKSILALAERFPRGGNDLAEHAAFAARRPSTIALQLLTVLARARAAQGRPVGFRALPTPRVFRDIERGFRNLRSRLSR
ncbi:MAG: hypothetical protein WBF03_13885 [Xanthobacteraceae bacterium]